MIVNGGNIVYAAFYYSLIIYVWNLVKGMSVFLFKMEICCEGCDVLIFFSPW